MSTENASGADNQQERLIKIGWIIGFVEGEGCFSVGIVKQPNRKDRIGYKTGFQVWHEFAVTQGESSLSALEEIKKFFGVGNLYLNKRYDNHKEHLYRYVVRRREELLNVIIPFFANNKMHTAKRNQFEKFVKILNLVKAKKHLNWNGLTEIVEIIQTMNVKKDRSDLIRILREHTPQS